LKRTKKIYQQVKKKFVRFRTQDDALMLKIGGDNMQDRAGQK
jgi:hypothetical protein